MKKDEIKAKVIQSLIQYNPEKIILFGSYAYGTPDKDSDLDLLVIKDIPEEEVRELRILISQTLWKQFKRAGIAVDVLVDSQKRIDDRIKLGDSFYGEIINKGQLLHA